MVRTLRLSSSAQFGRGRAGEKLSICGCKSRFTFASPENIFSMFTLECLSLNTKIFYDKKQKVINKFFYTKNLIPINFANHQEAINIVNKNLRKKHKQDSVKFNSKYWKKKVMDFDSYFLTC